MQPRRGLAVDRRAPARRARRFRSDELFLLDGRGTHDAARLVALPVGFECNRDEVWPWIGEHLLDALAASDRKSCSCSTAVERMTPHASSPYPSASNATATRSGRGSASTCSTRSPL